MTMTDAERPDTKAEVILGVDTHLDVHVVVALDRLGRRLGELSVPSTPKGYESLVRWAESFGTVRCAGVEGTRAAMVLGSLATYRHRESRCLRWSVRSALSEARAVTSRSPIPQMPNVPHERCWPTKRRACPRVLTAMWR